MLKQISNKSVSNLIYQISMVSMYVVFVYITVKCASGTILVSAESISDFGHSLYRLDYSTERLKNGIGTRSLSSLHDIMPPSERLQYDVNHGILLHHHGNADDDNKANHPNYEYQSSPKASSTLSQKNCQNKIQWKRFCDQRNTNKNSKEMFQNKAKNHSSCLNRRQGLGLNCISTLPQEIIRRQLPIGGSAILDFSTELEPSSNNTKSTHKNGDANFHGKIVQVSIDPASTTRIIPIVASFILSTVYTSIGTLRLFVPLIISRRIIVGMGYGIKDYLTGRYFRKSYTRLEKAYMNYIDSPAAFRALCRIILQISVYTILSFPMGWLVGITHAPCRNKSGRLAFLCGLLWVGAIVGMGHAFVTAVALWGGPIRIQVASTNRQFKNVTIQSLFSRPWTIIKWMTSPEEWISTITTADDKPFNPNSLLFPTTWIPLRLLEIYSIGKAISAEPRHHATWCSSSDKYIKWGSTDKNIILVLMSQYLIQHTLCDEWQRVFLGEKRIGLGICVAFVYLIALMMTIVTCAQLSSIASFMMLPSLIGIIISGWMNIIIFWNRDQMRRSVLHI